MRSFYCLITLSLAAHAATIVHTTATAQSQFGQPVINSCSDIANCSSYSNTPPQLFAYAEASAGLESDGYFVRAFAQSNNITSRGDAYADLDEIVTFDGNLLFAATTGSTPGLASVFSQVDAPLYTGSLRGLIPDYLLEFKAYAIQPGVPVHFHITATASGEDGSATALIVMHDPLVEGLVTEAPEPGTLLLMGSGLLMAVLRRATR